MTTLRVNVGERSASCELDGRRIELPIGAELLTSTELHGDPPRPEELTNAIGIVIDHLDDVLRELPGVAVADEVEVSGPEMVAIAAIEVGHPVDPPFLLLRDAAEDVFRTLATERTDDRARNPGLPPSLVHTIVAGSCVLVAVMRRLNLQSVTVVGNVETESGQT